ncbi:Elongation factor Ts, mitochondrial [Quillaja saponaria]|uniref:Elongation factor Ts, mitochondrial n=1 Tax=Quillaja saponaria TaxID=32244 RepID=A0AAD7VD36_QUISA|nr:Elongation factor Ts, mitochondrial [Quillaja saponaria]KAJ7971261.1 Elongation factor Ts, mitochondrial [Quillaja saponaria]
MAFSGGAKRICNKLLSCGGSSGRLYHTSICRRAFFSQCRETPRTSVPCNEANFLHGRFIFIRRFSVEAPAATDQMNLIKQLRERTSAPIKDVKASLVDSNWDIEVAQKELRKRGKVLASKKSSRTAAEGLLALAQSESKVAVIELNCETDFVARNEIFQHLALSLAKRALLVENYSQQVSGTFHVGPESLEDWTLNLEHPKVNGETTVQNATTEVAAMMGENVRVRRGFVMSTSLKGVISTYLHTSPQPGLGRIAGIVSLEVDDGNCQLDALQRVGSELAMHVVAAKPLFLTKELVSSDALQNEREILKSQAESSGKSQMAIDKMVEGRLRKYFEEVVLLEQKFIINDAMSVKMVLDNLSKDVGSPVKIGNFFRMEVGEGIRRLEASDGTAPIAQAV